MENSISVMENPQTKTRAQIIGENLKRIRRKKGYTRKQLADVIGITETSFGKYERGLVSPPIEKIFMLAEVMKISITELVGDTEFAESGKTFKYHLQRIFDLVNNDPMMYFPTMQPDGGVIISVPVEIENGDNGTRIFKQGYNNVKFKNTKDFVDVVERAIQRSVTDNLTFNQALRQIIFT